jgi:hypothetical protein
MIIDLGGYELDMEANQISLASSNNLKISNGKITFAYTVTQTYLFANAPGDNEGLYCEKVTIDNNSTVDKALIAKRGTFRDMIIELPDQTSGGFGGTSGDVFDGIIYNTRFIGVEQVVYMEFIMQLQQEKIKLLELHLKDHMVVLVHILKMELI